MTINTYVIYNKTTGEIRQATACLEEHIAMQLREGEDYVVGELSSLSGYVDPKTKAIMPLKAFSVESKYSVKADGVTEVFIPLPNGAWVVWADGEGGTIVEGGVTFCTDLPGTHSFHVSKTTYETRRIDIEAIL